MQEAGKKKFPLFTYAYPVLVAHFVVDFYSAYLLPVKDQFSCDGIAPITSIDNMSENAA